MATETLTPNGESSPQEWSSTGFPTHWECVQTDDGDTSYIYAGSGVLSDWVNMSNPTGIGAGDTINSVQVRFYGRLGAGSGVQIAPCVGDGSNTTIGTLQTVTSSYVQYTETFATRPSGGAWTLTDLNNLLCGVRRNVAAGQGRVTQIDAVVDYTASAPPAGAAPAAPPGWAMIV